MSSETTDASIDEGARRHFERARREGRDDPVEAFLPGEQDPRFLATLEELVHIELEWTWKQRPGSGSGDSLAGSPRVTLEELLGRFPVLNDSGVLQRLARWEYRVRKKHGDRPSADSYVRRFPAVFRDAAEVDLKQESGAGAVESADRRFMRGQTIGRYQLTDPYATGGFGVVWRAEDQLLERQVAFKHLRDGLDSDTELRQRFVREAVVTAQLEHPGIVPIYDLGGLAEESPYYTMKFVRGRTLEEVIREFHDTDSPQSTTRVERLRLLTALVSVARTVHYAHSRGIIHRDLKPQNILLGDFGETVILDWGLARAVGADRRDDLAPGLELPDSPLQTEAGRVQGTPAYMSPEQASGESDQVGEQSDVFSLGVILYQMLTGGLPFQGSTSDEILDQIRTGAPLPPREVQPRVDGALEAICLRAMERDLSDRYARAAEFVRDLECYLADEPISAWREPLTARLARVLRRHRTLTMSAAAVAVVSLVGLTVFSGIVGRKNTRLGELNTSLDRRNSELSASVERERASRDLADENATAAREQAQLSLSTLNAVIFDFQELLQEFPAVSEGRKRLLETSLERLASISPKFMNVGKAKRHELHNMIELAHLALDVGGFETEEEAGDRETVHVDGRITLRSAAVAGAAQFQKALYVVEDLTRIEPDDGNTRRNLGYVLHRLGGLKEALGHRDEADAFLERLLSVRRSLAEKYPDKPDDQEELVAAERAVGDVWMERGEPERALPYMQRALELQKAIAAGADADGRFHLTVVQDSLGQILLILERYDAAETQFRDGATVVSELLEDGDSDYPVTADDLAMFEEMADDAARRSAAFGEWDAILLRPPTEQRELLELRSVEFATNGNVEEAIQAADELRQLENISPDQLYNLACVYSLCLRSDPDIPLKDNPRAQRALECLRAAIMAGFDDSELLRSDSDLDAIRSLPAFRALLEPRS